VALINALQRLQLLRDMVVVSISLGSAVNDYFFYFLHLHNPSRIVHLQYLFVELAVKLVERLE
jgi:uncharacterized membrane protein YwzB